MFEVSLIKVKAFFKLVRWFHEVVVILPFLALYLVIAYFGRQSHLNLNLSGWDFSVLCLCIQTQIASGCVLNDIVDRDIDKINKPDTHIIDNFISLRQARVIFIVLTVFVVLLSAYITAYMFFEWIYISIGVFLLTLLYDFYLKQSPLLGNVLMAALTAFIPLVLFLFAKEPIRALNNERIDVLIYLYAAFPFLIIIPRELSLDISDIEGDRAGGCKTLPILIGSEKAKMVVFAFLFIIILLSVPLALKYIYLAPSLVVTDVLLAFYMKELKQAETRIRYIRIGRFLWFIMILGLVMFTAATLL